MAYATRNTVNRLARKELNSTPVVLELSKEKETYTLAVSEEKRRRANVIPVKRIYLLYLLFM